MGKKKAKKAKRATRKARSSKAGKKKSAAPEPRKSAERDAGQDDLLEILEALLFASHEPLSAQRIASALGKVRTDRVLSALDDLECSLDERSSPLQLVEMAGGYRLVTRPEFAPYLARLFHKSEKERLSPAALESLAIVAYRQPVTRGDIESIRGVQASPVLRALQDRKLIKVVGRANVVGRPRQYGTTRKFLDVFGLTSLKELPAAFGPDREAFGAPDGRSDSPPEKTGEEAANPVDSAAREAPAPNPGDDPQNDAVSPGDGAVSEVDSEPVSGAASSEQPGQTANDRKQPGDVEILASADPSPGPLKPA